MRGPEETGQGGTVALPSEEQVRAFFAEQVRQVREAHPGSEVAVNIGCNNYCGRFRLEYYGFAASGGTPHRMTAGEVVRDLIQKLTPECLAARVAELREQADELERGAA